MDQDLHSKEAFKIHGLKGMAFSDSDSDEGMDTEDYKEYEPPPIDISKCHVYTITQTNQWEEENAVAANPWQNIPQNTGAVHQNVTNNEYKMGKKIVENKNNTKSTKNTNRYAINLNQQGSVQLSEKSFHIYDIIKTYNQFPTTSKKKMQEFEEKFKSTKLRVNTTFPLPVSIKDLVRALVVAFLFNIDVQESTIDNMFQITTNISMLEHDLKLHFRNMMAQIMIPPNNVLFFEFHEKLERLLLQRYKEVHQPCLNGRLSRTVSPIDMAQNQIEKDVNSITKQDINNQVSESLFGNIQFLDIVLQLSSEAVEIYLGIKEHTRWSSTSTSQKQDDPLISEKIQMDLERSFLRAKPSPDNSVYTRIRELVRAITVALLFGINVSKSFIHPLKSDILQIDIEPPLLEIEVRKHFREMMALLQVPPENPIFFKLYTKLEDLIIQRNVQSSALLHSNVENTQKNTEVSQIDKIKIRISVKKRLSDLNFLMASLNLSKIAAQIYIIIRSKNQFVCHKNRILSAVSEGHRRLIENHYYQIVGKTTLHLSDLPSKLTVKDVVRAVSVALLFEIDIKKAINHLCRYEVDPVSLKREVKLHFKQMMAHLTILPNDQIFCLLYRKVEELLIPEVKEFNCVPSVLQVHNTVESASNFYSFGCDQNVGTLLPVLDSTYSGYLLPDLCIPNSYYAPANIQNNFNSYDSRSYTPPLNSLWSKDSYDKDFPVLSETSRKSFREHLINNNTQKTEVPTLNLANNSRNPGSELNITNRVVLPSSGAIPKEKRRKKRKAKNDLQQLLLAAIDQASTSGKVEVKNTESTENMVLSNNHSSEAVSINNDCTTEESETDSDDFNFSHSSDETKPGEIISEINESETIMQPTVIESLLKFMSQSENIMENGFNSEHPDGLSYSMSRHSVTEANIDRLEYYSTIDSVSRLYIQTPSTYSLQNQQVDTSTDTDTYNFDFWSSASKTNQRETVMLPRFIESRSIFNTQNENNMENGYNSVRPDGLSYSVSRHSVNEATIDRSEHYSINDLVSRLDIQTPSTYSLENQQVDTSTDTNTYNFDFWSSASKANQRETVMLPPVIESRSIFNTQNENILKNGYNSERPDGLSYSVSRHSVNEATIDRCEHHSTNDLVSRLDIQTLSTYSLENQQVDTSTGTTDHTIDLNTKLEEFLPGVSHVEEMIRSACNALVPYTNCESIAPEDLLLIRIRYLLILYFSIVLGISFLDWLLTNAFSILMVILVILFVK
ncbi:uncharacterized protein LOC126888322 isoform X3 [Diabrotica virgifera virgifera]|uniref:Uncharacterized protein n=1 Tax=Diabrotica virgifera virgifera TaxID=50390 RepID=A0ABM5KQF9_DIAVI|nr:uncharacterized protein LOC126888322 isoform X3 [Diabrotica virgifera virgifera]